VVFVNVLSFQGGIVGSRHRTHEQNMPNRPLPIAELLREFSDDHRILTLLAHAVGRSIERDFTDAARSMSWEQKELIRHVADWLKVAVAEQADWLGRLDTHGRPLKLMKFGSIEAAAKEADKAMHKRAQNGSAVRLKEGEEELHWQLNDGFYLVRLMTPEALDLESASMQHCIGHGAYDEQLTDGATIFYSLRDRFGKPHATLEVEDGWLKQCQGKQNKIPESKYVELMLPIFTDQKWRTYIPLKGIVTDTKYVIYDVKHLPDGFENTGNLVLAGLAITSLPRGLRVLGSLDIRGTAINQLPDGLHVTKNVYAQDSNLSHIGKQSEIGGDLLIDRTQVAEIPDDILVRGSLVARRTNIGSLHPSIQIGMNIDLSETPIRSLPQDLQVPGSLFLAQCIHLGALPQNLVVGRTLNLEGTRISHIPDGTKIGEGLRAAGSALTEIGTQRLFQYLDLSATPIKSLPDGLTIISRRGTGTLKLSDCTLESLGSGLRVVGRADLRGTAINQLPPDLSVRGELVLSGSQLESLPPSLFIAGTLDISHTRVKSLTKGLKVTGTLVAHGIQGLDIEDGLYVGKALDLCGSSTKTWSAGATVGSFKCNDATIPMMPHSITLKEFSGDGASIGVWPARMTVEGNFSFRRGKAGTMPDELFVGGNVDCEMAIGTAAPKTITAGGRANFRKARFQSFPHRLDVRSADFRNGTLEHLPATWRVREHLLLDRSRLNSIEDGLHVGGEFHFADTPLSRRQELEEAIQCYQSRHLAVGR
jgi:Leucine-rich repeat (LRR) protein